MDITTGVNVLLILLELHRWREKIRPFVTIDDFEEQKEIEEKLEKAKKYRPILEKSDIYDKERFLENLDYLIRFWEFRIETQKFGNKPIFEKLKDLPPMQLGKIINPDIYKRIEPQLIQISYQDGQKDFTKLKEAITEQVGFELFNEYGGNRDTTFKQNWQYLEAVELGYNRDYLGKYLNSANLRYANLSSADLNFADLRYADLYSADLSSADLSSANLSSAENLNLTKNFETIQTYTRKQGNDTNNPWFIKNLNTSQLPPKARQVCEVWNNKKSDL